MLVCDNALPSVLVGLGVFASASGVIVAFELLLLNVLASGARCVSFSSDYKDVSLTPHNLRAVTHFW